MHKLYFYSILPSLFLFCFSSFFIPIISPAPIIQFPSALLTAVSITLVPAISEAAAVRNQSRIQYTIHRTLLFTSLIGIGTCSIFAVFPHEIAMALYNQDTVGELLFKLSPVCLFLYLQITLSGLLNGLGEHVFIFRNNILSSFINISFIYFLMPRYGTDAFILGWLISLLITTAASIHKVMQKTQFRPNLKKMLLYPLLAITASGVMTKYLVHMMIPNRTTYFLCVLLMLLFYLLCLLGLGCIKISDILSIFHRKKKNGKAAC